jgi:hypothetical protein
LNACGDGAGCCCWGVIIGLGWNACSATGNCCLEESDFRLWTALGVPLSGWITLFRFLLSVFADPPAVGLGDFEFVGVNCALDGDFRLVAFVVEGAIAGAAGAEAVVEVNSFAVAGLFRWMVGFAT